MRRFQLLPSVTDSRCSVLPVTGAQRRFWFDRQLDPEHRPDVVPLFYAFPAGAVDVRKLESAARWLSARHPALRARLGLIRGVPVQIVDHAPTALVTRLTPKS